MAHWAFRSTLVVVGGVVFWGCAGASSQVFVVGEKSATADVSTAFTPTNRALPGGHLNELGRRELVRDLEAEQGFAHRALPMGAGLTLEANGPLSPGPEQYKKMLYEKGQAAGAGDRVAITGLTFKPDRLIVDLNGGPYAKHRFLSHVSLNDAPVTSQQPQTPTGSRVTLVFKGGIPDISAPEVKALLTPVIDFGAKTSAEAYADTLPGPLKEAIATHEVLVGMNRQMVQAAMGAPESKVREHIDNDSEGARYEDWIYGHVPQTVRFVRFSGDRVVMVKVCALGKPIEIRNENELGDYLPPLPTRQIAMGDANPADQDHPAQPPTLRLPGEAVPADAPNKVQFPTKSGDAKDSPAGAPGSAPEGAPAAKTPPVQGQPNPSSLVAKSDSPSGF